MCAHGLVAMCALSCLDNDLTLLQAALQEIIKLLGKSVHKVCVPALCKLHISVSSYEKSLLLRAHTHTHTHTHTQTLAQTYVCTSLASLC